MNIGELNLDIQVSTCSSCYNLVLEDHSYYLSTPEKPVIDITPPGFTSPIIFEFNASKTNIFTSYSFGLSPTTEVSQLPDGLYTITYKICPYDELYEKFYHIRTCKIRCAWDKQFLKIFDNCFSPDEKTLFNLKQVDALIIGAEIAAKACDPDKAVLMLRKANELITKFDCELSE